jgi:DNA-binding transcriptional ArsR family regulator
MLNMIARREMPVSELAESFDITLSAVSQHLGVLRQAGLVEQRKDGRKRLYRATPEPLKLVAEWLRYYEPFWSDRLEKLGEYLENNP